MTLIAVRGQIGSGKDTVAEYLVNYHGFHRESFANSLKDSVAAIFGWDRAMLEGLTSEARAEREEVDIWWSVRLGIQNLTPRWVLQHWGTEVCRHGFHDDIWIASLENKLRHITHDVVISDCRFPNEVAAIKAAGGRVIEIQRGPKPEWHEYALLANSGDEEANIMLANMGIHSSEYSLVGSPVDIVIDNDSTIDDLYVKVQWLAL